MEPPSVASLLQAEKVSMIARNNRAARLPLAIATVVLALVASACGAARDARDSGLSREMAAARRQLDDHMADCSKRYGYDPEAAAKLGPHVLGKGELEWRACVYQGIEKYMIPRTASPEIYRRAIAEDRKMTEAISKGTMTRAERRTRLRELVEEIDRVEAANRTKLQTQTLDRLETEMRQDMMRRSMSPLLR